MQKIIYVEDNLCRNIFKNKLTLFLKNFQVNNSNIILVKFLLHLVKTAMTLTTQPQVAQEAVVAVAVRVLANMSETENDDCRQTATRESIA
jgi:hypothetical protein